MEEIQNGKGCTRVGGGVGLVRLGGVTPVGSLEAKGIAIIGAAQNSFGALRFSYAMHVVHARGYFWAR